MKNVMCDTTWQKASLTRMVLVGVASLSLGVLSCTGAADEDEVLFATSSSKLCAQWVGTWSSSPLPADAVFFEPSKTFSNQTLRQIARVSVGGTRVRVRFSNVFGDSELQVRAAHVALQSDGASIYPWSDRKLTFGRRSQVTIPIGGEAISDPVRLFVPAQSSLAVSIYLPDTTGSATWHEMGMQTTYVSDEGNFTSAKDLPTTETTEARYWLSGVDVTAPHGAFSVVAFGDSIADGWGSTPNANRRWPDYLSNRLNGGGGPGGRRGGPFGSVGVLNQGISGNRVIYDVMGPNARDRFDRDVLAQPGVEYVVIMMGINDIGLPGAFGIPDQAVEADDIIAGLTDLVDRAHAEGLSVYGGTLTPFEGTTLPGYYTPEGEAKRQAVNSWIRSSGIFDAVLDFDVVLQDPEHPTQLLAEYDSGDHLHPSDAGYEAMAHAVDLSLF
ncbi:MAG: SGNH/GDSL hydrolase family protein [Polyangiaceae bacterium]|nr:SGNH/GDSL hydrolase family protein [Polyangiaceae bacterium]